MDDTLTYMSACFHYNFLTLHKKSDYAQEQNIYRFALIQGWATLLALRATLETI
jgi:hypothetical protein